MNSKMQKLLGRSIKKSLGRFLAIMIISMLGSAFFGGLMATQPAFLKTAQNFTDEYNLYDFRILSTYGIDEDDIAAVAALEDTQAAAGSIYYDAIAETPGGEMVIRIHSITEGVNDLMLVEGRMPENESECVIDSTYFTDTEIGDVITFSDANEEDTLEALQESYTVVGKIFSPLYMNTERGTTSIGNGKLTSFMYVLTESLDFEYYTEMYISLKGDWEIYSDEYNDYVDSLEEIFEETANVTVYARYSDIVSEAEEELLEGEQDYADGEQELLEGEQDYADGEQELADERAEGEQELADAWAEIEDGREQILTGRQELLDAEEELADAKAEYEEGLAEYEAGLAELADGYDQLMAGERELAAGWEVLEAARVQLEEAKAQLDAAQAQLTASAAVLESTLAQLEEAKAQLDAAKAQLDAAAEELSASEAQLTATKTALDAAKEELDAACSQLEETKAQLDSMADLYQLCVKYQEDSASLSEEEIAVLTAALSAYGVTALPSEEAGNVISLIISQYESGLAEYQAGQAQYEAGLAEYNAGLEQYNAGLAAYEEGKAVYEASVAVYEENLAAYEAGAAAYEAGLAEYNAGVEQYETGLAEYQEGLAEYEDGLAQYNSGAGQLQYGWDQYNAGLQELMEAQEQLEDAARQIADAEQEIADGWAELADAIQELIDGEAEYEDGVEEFYTLLAEAEEELAEARAELDDGWAELQDARVELDDGWAELADLEEPEVYIYGREILAGYVCFEADAGIVEAIAQVFPVFFFLIAALVCSTTMTRMVDEERGQIASLRAMGYGTGAVMSKYLIYAGLSAGTGSIIGYFGGCVVFPLVIWNAYSTMYGFGSLILSFSARIFLITFAAAMLCSMGSAYLALRQEVNQAPAQGMRPKAPTAGKRIFLEYIPFIWKRFSFMGKVSMRNIFRYKKRMIMMILGISGCTALVVTGFGIRDSVVDICDYQYGEIQLMDMVVTFQDEVSPEMTEALSKDLSDEVSEYVLLRQQSVESEAQDGTTKSVYLIAADESVTNLVSLHADQKELSYPGDGEVLISDKLAEECGVDTGDEITFSYGDGEKATLIVSGIFDNYVYHYAYISPNTHEEYFDSEWTANTVYISTADGVDAHELSTEIADYEGVSQIEIMSDTTARVENMLSCMDAIVLLILVCAGALAFVVLFNLSNINIQERVREIATIQVLGFSSKEVRQYVFRENLVLSAMGIVCGMPLGVWLTGFVLDQITIDMISFKMKLQPISFLYSAVIVFGFTLFVNQVMRGKLKKINMAEALKSIE